MPTLETPFTKQVGIEVPITCGAMYPCSNPELVAAASAAGAIGIVQPISLTYVHGHDLREGLRLIGRLAGGKPIGFNAIVEKSSRIYEDRMRKWVAVALEEGVRFFITALGNPAWVCEEVHAAGGIVYHDVTERRWAEKALAAGVDGLICVNDRAGGHAGSRTAEDLFASMSDLQVPLVLAGGVGDEAAFVDALAMGYAGVQMGTRFIASVECSAHDDYKQAIVDAAADDIVLTERISGVPVAVIRTPHVERVGTRAGWLGRRMLAHRKFKHWARTYYSIRSIFHLKKANRRGSSHSDYLQAGKSVAGIDGIEPVGEIIARFAAAARAAPETATP